MPQLPTRARLIAVAALVVVAVAWIATDKLIGRVAGLRVLGTGLLLAGLVLSLRPSLPVYSGFRQIATFTGWKKLILTAPMIVLGGLILFSN